MKKITSVLRRVADYSNDNKYISAIVSTFATLMPYTMAGSFASLFATLLCNTSTGLAAISGFEWLVNIKSVFYAVNFATITCMALLYVYVLGEKLGKTEEMPAHQGGLIALISYIIVVPHSITKLVEGVEQLIDNVLPSSSINASGLFLAFFIGIASVELQCKFSKVEKLKIKMPDSVPEGIARSFNSLLPIIFTLIIVTVFAFGFQEIVGMNLLNFIYNIIQMPLMTLAQTSAGIIAIRIFSQLFWFLGIHGGLATSAITSPIFTAALAENIENVNAGLQATNIVTEGTFVSFSAIGGAGNTLALIIAILICSKREDYREVAKFSLMPGVFGINEPIVFGLPIMFNPYLALPFFVCPLITVTIGYFAQYFGIIPCAVAQVSLGVPIFLRPFLYFGGSWKAAVLQLLLLILSIFIYLPFVKMANAEIGREEK